MDEKSAPRASWAFWLVAVLALLWNAFGAYDYWMSQTRGAAYLEGMGMTPDQIAYFNAMPGWLTGVWAIGVWGAVAGAILMLIRSRWAAAAYAASLAALLASLVYAHLLSDGGEVMGAQGLIMNAVITAAAVFFLWFSWRMAKRGVLR